ncbi:MAG: ShlB/FhaC/HecB family hemolysin secretion/activation protein [Burkholderiales bacterium]|nr:ShlB/FhaC/HecB family hemolysin secretion/activation protein [Burkholderiales bacterium]
MSLPKRLVPLLSCIALLPAVAWAQTPDAGTIQQEQQRTLQYYDLQRRLQAPAADDEPLIDDQTTRPKPAQPPTAEVRVQVNRIVVGPSEKLSRAEIEAVTAPYTGRDVTIRELFDAVAALNRLYRDKACVTCQAFLPPQKVEDGTVEIRLVEGRLGEVRVVGATAIRDGWILDRIRQSRATSSTPVPSNAISRSSMPPTICEPPPI